jgi:hypothetical protein
MELNRKVRFGNAIRYFVKKRISLTKKNIVGIGVIVFIGLFIMPALAADRFVDHGDGTVTDTKTGLMWATKDNGNLINWPNAQSYCQNYNVGGRTDWRMPTLAELTSLYDPGVKNRGGYHIAKIIDTTAASFWASDTRGYEAGRFNFTYGQVYWLRKSYSGSTRVLPVRSGN